MHFKLLFGDIFLKQCVFVSYLNHVICEINMTSFVKEESVISMDKSYLSKDTETERYVQTITYGYFTTVHCKIDNK